MAWESCHPRGIVWLFIGHGLLYFRAFISYRTKRSVIVGSDLGLVPDCVPDHPNPFVDGVMTILKATGRGDITPKFTPIR